MKKSYSFFSENWFLTGLLAVFAAIFSLKLHAQTAPAKQWDKSYFGGGSYGAGFKSLQQTSDGGYVLGGWFDGGIGGDKSQPSQGSVDYWIIKVDASGNKTWDKTFGGNDEDFFSCLQQTSDGGYILGGYSKSSISGDKTQAYQGSGVYPDYWVVKVDANGNKLWDKTFGGIYMDELTSLKQTADGGYLLGGSSDSGISSDKSQPSQGGPDYWVIKLDASGNKIWDKTFGGNFDDQFHFLQQTSDGGYILGGYSISGIGGDKSQNAHQASYDYWILKLDANGNKTWDKTLGGNNTDHLSSLSQTTDGGYILGGHSISGISGDKTHANYGLGGYFDYWVIKLDANGIKLWDKTFGGNDTEYLSSLQQTSDGGYILGGESRSSMSGDVSEVNRGNIGSPDYWIVKLDANGNKTWDKRYGGTGWSNFDQLYSVQQTSDGGFILGGNSGSNAGGDKSPPSFGGSQFWIVKLGAGVTGMNEALSTEISLYPNPTSGLINIGLKDNSKAQITVFNALGQCIIKQTSQGNNMQLDLSSEVKGIYTIQIVSESYTNTRKMVLH